MSTKEDAEESGEPPASLLVLEVLGADVSLVVLKVVVAVWEP